MRRVTLAPKGGQFGIHFCPGLLLREERSMDGVYYRFLLGTINSSLQGVRPAGPT